MTAEHSDRPRTELCRYCERAAVSSCLRCDADLCDAHRHDALHRCRACEREFRGRPSRQIVSLAVGSVMIGTSAVMGAFVGLIVAYALASMVGIPETLAFLVFLVCGALGLSIGGVAAHRHADSALRTQFLREREHRPAKLPEARVHRLHASRDGGDGVNVPGEVPRVLVGGRPPRRLVP